MPDLTLSPTMDFVLQAADADGLAKTLSPWATISSDTTLTIQNNNATLGCVGGAAGITITLPTLVAGDAGWRCILTRVDRDYGVINVVGAGYSNSLRTRRSSMIAMWNGSEWITAVKYGPLESEANPNQFGSALDGDVTVTGAVTLTRDMVYKNLTISGAGSIFANGWRIFVEGDLDLRSAGAGAIKSDGAAGANGNANLGGAAGAAVVGNTIGAQNVTPANGANGGTGVGAQAVAIAAGTRQPAIGIMRNSGCGAGGAGVSAGGALRAATPGTVQWQPLIPMVDLLFRGIYLAGGAGGNAGSAGGGDGTNNGGGGGGQAKGGGCIAVYARRILVGSGTATSAIRANGGAGGNGGNAATGNCGGGGGAGGGQGGMIFVVAGEIVGTKANAICANGGAGGNGGNGVGTGLPGGGGDGGGSGRSVLLHLSERASFTSAATADGPLGSGQTGGAGLESYLDIAEA
jgi:hypothetical protein